MDLPLPTFSWSHSTLVTVRHWREESTSNVTVDNSVSTQNLFDGVNELNGDLTSTTSRVLSFRLATMRKLAKWLAVLYLTAELELNLRVADESLIWKT